MGLDATQVEAVIAVRLSPRAVRRGEPENVDLRNDDTLGAAPARLLPILGKPA